MPGPLAGQLVIDLTTFLSGPYCTQILADLGAEVIKVERIDGGDSTRQMPPYFIGSDSAYFLSVNRNKRSIALDTKSAGGLDVLRRLIAKADVVVENYRPGVAKRLGVDPESLCAQHGSLIWASISGFGQTGPWSDKPAYDMIVQALSGVMSLTGEEGRPAVRLGIPAGDMVAGMYAAIAINAALVERGSDGPGKWIDISMLDCQLSMLSYQAAYALAGNVTPKPQSARHDSIPTYRSFVGGDGREFVVTANTEAMWRDLCRVIGCATLIDDPRFGDAASRLANRDELWALLEQAFLKGTAASWVEHLAAAGVPTALIKSVPEALRDARDHDRDMVMDMAGPDGVRVSVVGDPIKFHGVAPSPGRYPPRLGEGGRELLQHHLGLTDEAVDGLLLRGELSIPSNDRAVP